MPATATRRFTPLRLVLLAAGAAVFVYLVARTGVPEILAAFALIGVGLLPIVLWNVVRIALQALGWAALLVARQTSILRLMYYSLINEALNNLLPVARIGGEIARGRLLARELPGAVAGASVVVDFSIGVATQLAFVLAGLAAYAARGGAYGGLVWASVLFALLFTLFVLALQHGLFERAASSLERLIGGGREWTADLRRLDAEIRALYTRRAALARCFVLRLAGWISSVGESWLILFFLGLEPTLGDALVVEALGFAARGIAFLVPGALGVQEGLLMLAAAAVGFGADTGLIVSLVKRVRELALGLPGIGAWLFSEPAFRARSAKGSNGESTPH